MPHRAPLFLGILGFLLLGLAPSARAGEPRARSLLQAYSKEHGFEIRAVVTGPSWRRVTRYFAPITPESLGSFCKTFSAPNGAIHLCWDGGSHIATGVNSPGADNQPADCYLWARNYNGKVNDYSGSAPGDYRNMYMKHNPNGGRFWGADVGVDGVKHLAGELEKARSTGRLINPIDNSNLVQGTCMAWQSHIEAAPGVSLFHLLGCKRVKGDGPQHAAKLNYVANDRVVVGICVASGEAGKTAFKNMTDEQLLGQHKPKAGIDESAVK